MLPWMQEAERRGASGLPSNCSDCMLANSLQTRQTLGCGYEPVAADELSRLVRIMEPLGSDIKPTTCPGFTTRLPEVIEIARARLHWSKGELTSFCSGQARGALLAGIEILEGATNETQMWCVENPVKKGGA